MDEIYIGLVVVILVVFTIKTINTYHNYKNTIYPEIYSGFFEFLYRKASPKRLSTSSWLESNFGKHRIVYWVNAMKHRKVPKLYVMLILSSGIYIINSKNLKGKVEITKQKKCKFTTSFINKETKIYGNKAVTISSPIEEVKSFTTRIKKITEEENIAMIVQFLNDSTFIIDENNNDVACICSKDFFTTIANLHKKRGNHLTEQEIESIYEKLQKEVYKIS